jgi:serine/threonine-protein kinase
VAVEINDNGFGEIWVIDAERGTRIPITRTPDVWEYGVRWSPDARYVAYSVAGTRAGRQQTIRRRLADGSGAEEVLAEVTPSTLNFIKHWAPDGRSIVFAKIPGGLFTAPVAAKGEVSPVPGSSDSEIDGRLSPDGRWLAYTTTESGRGEVYVRPATGGQRTLVSTAGGVAPVWNRKGTELYYAAADGTIMAVPVSTAGSFGRGDPKPLFKKALSLTQTQLRQPFTTIDGERFLVRVPDASSPPSITWVMNWATVVAAAH